MLHTFLRNDTNPGRVKDLRIDFVPLAQYSLIYILDNPRDRHIFHTVQTQTEHCTNCTKISARISNFTPQILYGFRGSGGHPLKKYFAGRETWPTSVT